MDLQLGNTIVHSEGDSIPECFLKLKLGKVASKGNLVINFNGKRFETNLYPGIMHRLFKGADYGRELFAKRALILMK